MGYDIIPYIFFSACRYSKGNWTACDAVTNQKSRVDSLKPGSEASCEATRTVSKVCKAKANSKL